MGDKIGIGKESDVFIGRYNEKSVVLKFHRLGRTSFRSVKNNRDYHGKRSHLSWMCLCRISAEKEFGYLSMFYGKVNVPQPFDTNRHVVIMEHLSGYLPLYRVRTFDLDVVYCKMMRFIEELYEMGYIHGDLNEFNIMIKGDSDIIIIDLPQCVDRENLRSKEYLRRDVACVKLFFQKKFRYTNDYEVMKCICN
jgi:RIO kinase 2